MYCNSISIKGEEYMIRSANELDIAAVQGLLTSASLPTVGVDFYIKQFLVAEQREVIGTIGIHYDGGKALLRSFVVNPQNQKCGVGMALVKQAMQQVKSQGIKEVYLLTETALEYFKQIGFWEINREQIPKVLLEESGLDQACPCGSYCMKFSL